MANYERFRNPPIREALLDIQVNLPGETNIDSLNEFQKELSNDFNETKTVNILKSRLKIPKNGEKIEHPIQEIGKIGYSYHSPKDNKTIQVRANGYTFNKLNPYKSWESLRDEAQSWWGKYIKVTKPERVHRVALRYINIIKVKAPIIDFSDYLVTNPILHKDLPQAINNFLIRLELPNPEIESSAIITVTMKPPEDTVHLPLILDIDVIKICDYNKDEFDRIWQDFELLRNFKNDIFFKTTTEKARELFR